MSFTAQAVEGTIFEEAERQRIWSKVQEEEGVKQRIWDKYGKDPDIKEWFRLMDRVTLDLFRISLEGILGINPETPIELETMEIRKLKAEVDGAPIGKPSLVPKIAAKCKRCGAGHPSKREALYCCRETGAGKRKKPTECKRCGVLCEGAVEAAAHCKGKPVDRASTRRMPADCKRCGTPCRGTFEAKAHCKGKSCGRPSRRKPTMCMKCETMHETFRGADLCCRKARKSKDESITIGGSAALG